MYYMGDDTWKKRPKRISRDVIESFLSGLEDYIQRNSLPYFGITLHGGEPLLLPKPDMSYLLSGIRRVENATSSEIQVSLQTNGVLVDKGWLSLFEEFECRIGISHDGPPAVSDKYRVYHNLIPSGGDAEGASLQLNGVLPDLFDGCLVVIDPTYSPEDLISYFYRLGIQKIDLLLPDQNYINSPPNHPSAVSEIALYTDYLIRAFDHWLMLDDPDFDIRFFRQLVLAVFGKGPTLDSIGEGAINMFTLDTDGSIDVIDTFRICDGIAETGLNITSSSLDDFEKLDHVKSVCGSKLTVPNKCSSCEHYDLCGGGYLPHRFNGTDFHSPSVYCQALFALCEHIKSEVLAGIPQKQEVTV